MKKIWLASTGIIAVIGLLLLSGCDSGVGSGDVKVSMDNQQQGIWVSAVGKVNIEPDLAILSLGVESQETSVAQAMSNASAAMAKILQALKDNGVADKDIQTRYFNIAQVNRWDNYNEKQTVIGYRVTNTAVVKIRDIEKAGNVIDAVVVAGGDLTRINSIDFTVEEPSVYYKQARTLAMQYAGEKARQMADEGKVKLGDITYITENSNTYYQPYGNYMMNDSMVVPMVTITAPAPISIGQLEISTTVQVAYAISR